MVIIVPHSAWLEMTVRGTTAVGINGEKLCLNGWSEPSSNCTVRKYCIMYDY